MFSHLRGDRQISVPDKDRVFIQIENSRGANFFVFTPSKVNESLPNIPWGDLVPGDTNSQASLSQVRQQLDSCITEHTNCDKPNPKFCPKRLICVHPPTNANEGVTLADDREYSPGISYLALSYCWGAVRPPCITESSSLAARRQHIPWDTLAPTFRDAIEVARWLQVDYVWIDSICIIQDDPADWAREASKMYEVYQNAYVTLAALHGEDSSAGLFTKVKSDYQVKLVEAQTAGQTIALYSRGPITCFLHPNLYMFASSLESLSEPLMGRAWCFQERLMSPRTIYFGPHGLVWECCTHVCCECYNQPFSVGCEIPKAQRSTNFVPPLTMKQKFFRQELYKQKEEWHRIVSNYTASKLSKPPDRLIAIGAIARCFAMFRKDETYLAGLWSGTFVHDLTWKCEKETPISILGEVVHGGTEKTWTLFNGFVAPTWSWASVNESVYWDGNFLKESDLEVLEVKIENIAANPFGPARSGVAGLRAYVGSCSIEYAHKATTFPWLASIFFQDEELKGFAHLDCRLTKTWEGHLDRSKPEPSDVTHDVQATDHYYKLNGLYMVFIGISDSGSHLWLLCRREPNDATKGDVFSRMGFVTIPSWHDFDWPAKMASKKREINLI